MDMIETMASRLKTKRKERKWSRPQLARQAGISVPYMYDIEQGKRNPSPVVLARLADALQVSIDFLLGRTDFASFNTLDPADIIALQTDNHIKKLLEAVIDLPKDQIVALCDFVHLMTNRR